jgi:hypothetical protein
MLAWFILYLGMAALGCVELSCDSRKPAMVC